MNLTDKQKQWVPWTIVIALASIITALSCVGLGVYLGVTYFVPSPPDEVVILGTTHVTNLEAEDVTVTDDLAVTDDTTLGGDLTVSGTTSWGCTAATIENSLDLTGTLVVTGATTLNSTLTVDGGVTNIGGGSPDVAAGDNDLFVTADLEVDGEIEADGAIDADAGMTIDGGVTNIGGGSPDVAAGDNDLFVTADLEVDGELELDGTIDVDGVMTGQDDLEHIFFPTVASTAFTYTASAGGTVVLWTIADGEVWIIHDIYVNVTTNFDCTDDDCTVNVGDGGDTDGLCDLDDAELQAADTEVTGAPAGWQCFGADTVGAYIAAGRGMIYAPSGAAETIDALLAASGDDFSAGAATAYIVYTRIQ